MPPCHALSVSRSGRRVMSVRLGVVRDAIELGNAAALMPRYKS
jgi:hypothetical protein